MYISNIYIYIKMIFDLNVWKAMWKLYCLYKTDQDFNLKKYLKLIYSMIRYEKISIYNDSDITKYIVSSWLPPIPSNAMFTMVNAVPNLNHIFKSQIFAIKAAPSSIHLCLTSRCPNNCSFCSVKGINDEKLELNIDQWASVINSLQDMNVADIGFIGGEPLIYKGIIQLVKIVDSRSISRIFTSGFNLNYNRAQKLKNAGLFAFHIGVDMINSDKDMKRSIQAIKISRSCNIYTIAMTVMQRESLKNPEEIYNFFRFLYKIGVHEIQILEPLPAGQLFFNFSQDIFFTEKDRNKMVEIQHKVNKMFFMPKISFYSFYEGKEKMGCNAGIQHSYISSNGDLYPCDFVQVNFGNVLEKDVKELWKEMNNKMSIPKLSCLSRKFMPCMKKKGIKHLPIHKDELIKFIKSNNDNIFPKSYQITQGIYK